MKDKQASTTQMHTQILPDVKVAANQVDNLMLILKWIYG